MKYKQFIFKDYAFDAQTKSLTLRYGIDEAFHFTEKYTFDFDFVDYSQEALDRALQLLFFLAGVSYYKTFLPSEIVVLSGQIDNQLAKFLSNTYQSGLGEFFYINGLDPKTQINFPINQHTILNVLSISGEGALVGLGGGKDSLVSAEILRNNPNVATWSVGHKKQLEPLVDTIGLPHLWVTREWDKQLLALKDNPEAYNGHVPISAILAAAGTVTAILSGHRDVVVSNESSANEPNLIYKDVKINHQYSKSLQFEKEFQEILNCIFGESVRYYSLLRPFSELYIAELFARFGFQKYKKVFSSCNRAFTHQSESIFWCGVCPKCAFVYLILTPFVEKNQLTDLFGGKNLLLDPGLDDTYRQLLGIQGDKPLDCVGEIKESRTAMQMAQKIYPELTKYKFDLPKDYDFRKQHPHSMPTEAFRLLQSTLQNE